MKTPKQVELNKRAAAAMAHSTAGRSRITNPNKKGYNRKRDKNSLSGGE